jgi:hypothetical protein
MRSSAVIPDIRGNRREIGSAALKSDAGRVYSVRSDETRSSEDTLKINRRVLAGFCGGVGTLGWLSSGSVYGQSAGHSRYADAATGALSAATYTVPNGTRNIIKKAPFFSTGPIMAAENAMGVHDAADTAANTANTVIESSSPLSFPDLGMTKGTLGCGDRDGDRKGNVRVNQDCSFRRQAEEKIIFNPAKPNNLLAGMNDSRVGFNQCGIAWSTDNGAHWGDLLPPFRQRLNNPAGLLPTASDPNRHTIAGGVGTQHTYDVGSDPAPAFDSHGRAFFGCVTLDVNSNASMVYVTQSPVGAQGSFFFNLDSAGSRFIVVEDNSPNISHDKPFVAADGFAGSPNRDNVYATWTVFKFGCGPNAGYCSSEIYGSMSTDHGVHWSTPEEISGQSPSLCFFGNIFDPSESPNDCDLDQGSDPIVLPNGKLVVTFNNGNTSATDPNSQQLAVQCSPSGSSPDGTAHLNCDSPNRVGADVVVNEPACDFGRGPEECIPGPFIRTNDFPRIAVNRASGDVFVVWQDFRNNEFDIQLARSTDGGRTWSEAVTVNPDRGLDHYFPAVDVAQNSGKNRVGVSYFRSQQRPTGKGLSDYVLAGGTELAVPFNFNVLSPVFAPPDGNQAGFNGDYSGLTINKDEEAHPIWSDTRNEDPFAPANGVTHDEDVFTSTTELPDGVAKASRGRIGKP